MEPAPHDPDDALEEPSDERPLDQLVRVTEHREVDAFAKDARAHVERLSHSKEIEVLTIAGEEKAMIVPVEIFDELLERLDSLESTERMRQGLADIAAGQTVPAREALFEIAREFNLELEHVNPQSPR